MAKAKKINIALDAELVFRRTIDPRRKQEMKDSQMVQEDMQGIANLSPKAINREFNAWACVERFKPGNDEVY